MRRNDVFFDISIHAPTKGATFTKLANYITKDISIHAPTKGATVYASGKVYDTDISIHAPTKGATFAFVYVTDATSDFNPRSHEGSDFSEEWEVVD